MKKFLSPIIVPTNYYDKMSSPNITPTAGELDAFIVSANVSSAIAPAYLLCFTTVKAAKHACF